MILCIAEKHSLAEAAGKVLADMRGQSPEFDWDAAKSRQYNRVGDVKFVWLDGHAIEQCEPDAYLPADVPLTSAGKKRWRAVDLPIIPARWLLHPKEQKQRRLSMIADDLKASALVWHLGDPDEEGQLLVDECLQFFGYRGPVKRILINDYNVTPVRAALSNLRDNTEPMFRAWYMWALARSRYDWLLGMNATRAMTLRARELGYDGKAPLPVGSVQTPLLYIVRERDRLIEHFRPIPYFTMTAQIAHANGEFRARWKPGAKQRGLDSKGRLIDSYEAADLTERVAGVAGSVTAYSSTLATQRPPLPLSMNELQMEAFARWKYSAQAVLDAAQVLYEKRKVLSYPRSDNRYLSLAKHGEASTVMAAAYRVMPALAALAPALDASRRSEAFNDKKMEGTPHHGIIPTVPEIPVASFEQWPEIERNVYELAARTYLAQFAAPYEYQQTSIEVDIAGECFAAGGRTPIAPGWKAIYAEADVDADDQDHDDKQALPAMRTADDVTCLRLDQAAKSTKPPARFDEGLLIDCMKNLHKYVSDDAAGKRLKEGEGIGTTATRSAIIKDMRDRDLLVPVKAGSAKLMTSPAARFLIDALPFDVKNPAQAGYFKAQLDAVATASNPDGALAAFEASIGDWIRRIVADAKALDMTLPTALKAKEASAKAVDTRYPCACGNGHMQPRKGPKGPFWGCSAWPECKQTQPDDKGKPAPRPAPPSPGSGDLAKCPKCGKSMRLVPAKGERKPFWSCTGYPECKSTANDQGGQPVSRPAPTTT